MHGWLVIEQNGENYKSIQIFLRYHNFLIFFLGGGGLNCQYMIKFQDLIHPIQHTSNLSTWTQKVCIQMPFLSFVLKIISHNLTVVLQDRITSIIFIVPALTKKWAFNLDNTSCFAETVLLLIFFLCVYAYVMMEFDEEDSHSISLYIYLTVKAHVQFHNSLPTHSATF